MSSFRESGSATPSRSSKNMKTPPPLQYDDYYVREKMKKPPQQHVIPNAHDQKRIGMFVLSSDDKWLVSSGDDEAIKVWNLSTLELYHSFEMAHHGAANCMDMSGDSKYVISCSKFNGLALWSIIKKQLVKRRNHSHFFNANCIRVAPSATLFVSGSKGTVKIWSMFDINLLRTIRLSHNGWISCFSFKPHSQSFLSCGHDGSVKCWNVKSGVNIFSIPNVHKNGVCGVCVDFKGEKFITCGFDGVIKIWSVSSKLILSTIDNAHEGTPVCGLSVPSRIPLQVVSSYSIVKKQIKVWGIDEKNYSFSMMHAFCNVADNGNFNALAASPDGLYLASSIRNKDILLLKFQ